MINYDPQKSGPQYLEDLATGYWFSEVLFTAVEMDLFSILEPQGKTLQEIAGELNCAPEALIRYLSALTALGLLSTYNDIFYNTQISAQYLVKGRKDYQGNSILWRKYLFSYWKDLKGCLQAGGRIKFHDADEDEQSLRLRIQKYIDAMDSVARTKITEIIPIFAELPLKGSLLDVGTGSGAFAAAFLDIFPELEATLLDIPQVLTYSQEVMQKRGYRERISYTAANILEPWPLGKEQFELIILSNIIHAYSEKEAKHILKSAVNCLKPDGYLLIHDFFLEHYPQKAALLDLNMLINTYNGKVFSCSWLEEELERNNLQTSGLIPLETDTALLIASKSKHNLDKLAVSTTQKLSSKIKKLGFKSILPIKVDDIQLADWTDLRCRFGCEYYQKPHCPPYSPPLEKTKNTLKDYNTALLLEGEPPTRDFQRNVLKAEKEAFKAGFYKAFTFWAGPCSLCENCESNQKCKRIKDSRPSMEGSGIDVYKTVQKQGIYLKTLAAKDEYIKYFALLLLE